MSARSAPLILGFALAFCAGESANAYCSAPSAPFCVQRYGPFDDDDAFQRCKREMESFQIETQSFLSCLKRDSDGAVEAYNDVVASFNRRARGY